MNTKDQAIAWADDAAFEGRIGNVCSTAAKRYWEKSDWVDRKKAELHVHPLYAAQPPAPDCRTCDCHVVSCWSDLPCTNGNQYVEAPAVVLWGTE
jgi:hypothetical protein